jgi:hypothetical protein
VAAPRRSRVGQSKGLVRVWASTDERAFELAVANQGDPIKADILERLFQPLFRVAHQTTYQGLGNMLRFLYHQHGRQFDDCRACRADHLEEIGWSGIFAVIITILVLELKPPQSLRLEALLSVARQTQAD